MALKKSYDSWIINFVPLVYIQPRIHKNKYD